MVARALPAPLDQMQKGTHRSGSCNISEYGQSAGGSSPTSQTLGSVFSGPWGQNPFALAPDLGPLLTSLLQPPRVPQHPQLAKLNREEQAKEEHGLLGTRPDLEGYV